MDYFLAFGILIGIFPISFDKTKLIFKFKLFSWKSLQSLIVLLLIGFSPFITLAVIFSYIGSEGPPKIQMLTWSLYVLNTSFILLPFIFGKSVAEPFTRYASLQDLSAKHKVVYRTGRSIRIPMMSFLLFNCGQMIIAIDQFWKSENHVDDYLEIGKSSVPNFWMQFLFCFYEVFFFITMASVKLDLQTVATGLTEDYFEALDDLIRKIKAFQDTFSLFLLLDFSFMTIFWILHLFTIYICIKDKMYILALGSFMIVLAELWRVFIITTECHTYQDEVKTIINNIKEVKGEIEEKKKNVSNVRSVIYE